jgi:alkylation response protein AidB-like acyl-CoA dehydrogenase
MISGEWTGTMNLTEPQAGSDLAQLKSRAVRSGEHYLVTGQKIFITYGEHDLTENIVHLVLARTPDAPAGVRGISLFIVPKFLVGADGKPGKRNDLRCVSLEHKLGIHASPTCVMSFGDDGGAVGYLVGEEGRGLSYMFTMMNNARLSVGIQGLAIAERAYQQASAFAKTRVQSKDDGSPKPEPVSIIHHADVRRMLMTMRAQIEAMRALGYYTAAGIDGALRHPDKETARRTQDRVDLLIPIVKAWFTDLGNEIASIGVQVHGGMGFIEETGAAQHLRDARILPIYEGTNGIQARDLVGRKVAKDGGETMLGLVAEMRAWGGDEGGPRRRPFGHWRRRSGRRGGAGRGHQMGRPVGQGRPRRGAGGLGALPAAGRHGAGRLAAGQERAGGPDRAGDPRRRSRLPRGQAGNGAVLCRGHPAAGAGPARTHQGRRPHGVRADGGPALTGGLIELPADEAEAFARRFDLAALEPAFLDDPFPYYHALRRFAPLKRLPDGSVFLSRYADVAVCYRDPRMSSDKKAEFGPKFGVGTPLYRHHTTSLVFNDPPLHTRVRKLLAAAFTPRARRLQPR